MNIRQESFISNKLFPWWPLLLQYLHQKNQEDILQSSLVSDGFSYHPNIN